MSPIIYDEPSTEDEPAPSAPASGIIVPKQSGTLDDIGPAALSPAAGASPPTFASFAAPEPVHEGTAITLVDGGPVAHVKEKDEDKDKVLVGNLIGEDHVNYVLMYNMLTGIRIGVRLLFRIWFWDENSL